MRTVEKTQSGSYCLLSESFRRSVHAQNKSPRTIQTYMDSLRLLGEFLQEQGMPTDISHIKREHVEAFIADLLERKH